MPIHVKSAYYYNLLLNRLNLTNKYESINSGDKVRYFYVSQPNRFGIKSVAYKYYYPEEFQEFITPDTEQMFEKIVYSVVERFYEAVGWQCRRPSQIVQTDLFELLQP
jgi:DNA polymerase elongation subunit (family B)